MQHSAKILRLHSDQGREYLSRAFSTHLTRQGMEHRLTMHATPQENGATEWLNRMLLECIWAILHAAQLPKSPWGEALMHAIWLKNRTLTRALENTTLHDSASGLKMRMDIPFSKELVVKEAEEAQEVIKIFLDGSCLEGGIGAVAVLFRGGVEKRSVRMRLGKEGEHTVFEAELMGLTLAAELLCSELVVDTAMLGADSQAALRALGGAEGVSGWHLVDRFHKEMGSMWRRHAGADIGLRWTPGHVGLAGNERADEEAKRAVRGEVSLENQLPRLCRGILPKNKVAELQNRLKKIRGKHMVIYASSPRYK